MIIDVTIHFNWIWPAAWACFSSVAQAGPPASYSDQPQSFFLEQALKNGIVVPTSAPLKVMYKSRKEVPF